MLKHVLIQYDKHNRSCFKLYSKIINIMKQVLLSVLLVLFLQHCYSLHLQLTLKDRGILPSSASSDRKSWWSKL